MPADTQRQAILSQSPRQGWWTRQYTSFNLLSAEMSPLGNVTRYEYTHREAWHAVVDPNGNRTEYVRDKRHRISEIHRFGGVHRRYLHNLHNVVVEEQDGNGHTLIKYETGPTGLHTSATLASGERYSWAYDARGRFTEASSSEHRVIQRRVGRKLALAQRDGKGVEHRYGAGLRVAGSKYFDHFKVRHDYLSTHQVRITTPDGAIHTFWNTAKRIIRENGNGTSEALSFDAKDRLCARACWQKALGNAGPSWSNSYRYDAAGNLVARMDTEGGPDRYEYDADNRLIAHENRSGTHPYAYDAAGNLVRTARLGSIGYAAGNLLSRADFSFYTQDSRFRRATKNVPGKSLTEYSYDSLDQLNKVRLSTDGQQKLWCAGYDGLGRRVWREIDGKRTDFYWDGDRLAAERSPDGKLRLYVYPNEDALVPFMWLDYASDEAAPESGQAFYRFADPSGMPVRVEDAAGIEVWRADSIDPYGEVHGQGGAACPTRLRFAGHFYDEDLGLFYNRFRDYDPQLGRYLQPDRLGHAGGLNLFAYSANPLVEVDLRGLAHRKNKDKKSESADTEEKPPSTEKTQQEIQAARLKEIEAAAQKTLDDIGPIGPKARGELEAMPGGKALMDSIDSTTDPIKKLEQTQVAAVALESQRSGDNVQSIEKVYPKPGGGETTRTDVETDTKVVEVKGKDNSKKTSLSKKESEQATEQRKIARGSDKEHVVRSPSMNDDLADKTTKRGSTVDRRPFDTDGLKE